MRKFILFSLLSTFTFFHSFAQSLPDKQFANSIDQLIASRFKPGEPGMAMLVSRKGKVLYEKAFGCANLELGVPLQTNMLFRIGSVTKQFTAMAILQLAEQKRLQLHDSLQQYISDFPARGSTITIAHLLSHTSGIRDYMSKGDPTPFIERHDFTPAQLVNHVKNDSLLAKPGTQYIYSNTNYVLLGLIIEKITGMSYHVYVTNELLKKSGLQNSRFAHERTIVERRVPGYSKQGQNFENASYQSLSLGYACGDLLSTVGDLFQWNEAVFKNKLLGKKMLDSALAPVKLANGNNSFYGFGWMNQIIFGKKCYRHDGSVMGFGAEIRYFPEEEIFLAFLINGRSGESDARTMEVMSQVTQLSLGMPVRSEIALPPVILEQYKGIYVLNEEHKLIVTLENGQLFIEASNPADQMPKVPVYAYKPDSFFVKGPDFILEFNKNKNGNYEKVTTTSNGKFILEWKKKVN